MSSGRYFEETPSRENTMTEQNYEIDIEAGHEDEEMQVDDEPGVRQRGRGFGGSGGDSQVGVRHANATSTGIQGPATAVRCTPSSNHP